jgi:hypothetical protein
VQCRYSANLAKNLSGINIFARVAPKAVDGAKIPWWWLLRIKKMIALPPSYVKINNENGFVSRGDNKKRA